MKAFKYGFIRDIFSAGSFTFLIQGSRFLSTIILSRLLFPNEYGLVAMIQVFSGFVLLFRNIGLSSVVVREIELEDSDLNTFHSITILIGVVQFVILSVLAYPISVMFYDKRELFLPTVFISINFFLNGFTIIPISLLRKERKFNLLGKMELTAALVGIVLVLFFAYSGFSYWSLIIQELAQSSVILFLLVSERTLKFKSLTLEEIKHTFLKYRVIIVNSVGFGLINYFSRNYDNIIVGKQFGDRSLGIYNRGYSLLYMINSLVSIVLSRVVLPTLNVSTRESGKLKNDVDFINKFSLLPVLPFSILFYFCSEQFVRFIWGEEWMDVSIVLKYFGILILVQSPLSLMTDYLVSIRKEKLILVIGIVSAIVSIIAITLGAQLGYVEIARYYAIANLIIILPFNFYVVLISAVGLNAFKLFFDWALIIVCSFLLVYFDYELFTRILLFGLIVFQMILFFRNEIITIIKKIIHWKIT